MIEIDMHTHPRDETCEATSLHANYRDYGHHIALQRIINKIERSISGGTLAFMSGKQTFLSSIVMKLNDYCIPLLVRYHRQASPQHSDNYYKVSVNCTVDANLLIMYPGEN